MYQVALLLSITAEHLLLTALPGVAATILAARRGVRDTAALLSVAIVGAGFAAVCADWTYYASPLVGRTCSYAIVGLSLIVAVRGRHALRSNAALVRLRAPVALWCLGVAFLVLFGFLHLGTRDPLAMAARRFSHQLPSDNALPFWFAEPLFVHGHEAPPRHIGGWLSSDRPPLQSGFVLAQRTFSRYDEALHYQVLGVVLQQTWILGLWALLTAARVRAATRAIVVVAVLLSDVAIVNGFFIWPKLLAATYLLAAASFILTDQWCTARGSSWSGVLIAALAGLALLSHGGSIFGIIPLAIIAGRRGLPTWRWIAAGLAVMLVLLLPWVVYGRVVDPPGDRLIKWMIAGVTDVDGRSVYDAIADSYAAVGVAGAVRNKVENFHTMAGGSHAASRAWAIVTLCSSGRLEEAVRQVRGERFFFFLQSLGVFALVPLAMLARRSRARESREDWAFSCACFRCAVIGCLGWGLVMFGPSTTVIHAGSLALPLIALVACVVGLSALSWSWAAGLVALHAALNLAIYAPAFDPLPATAYSAAAASGAALCLAGFIVVAWRVNPELGSVVSARSPAGAARCIK